MKFLDEREVAKILTISVASMRRWRLIKQGPKYIKIGSHVLYRPEDVDAWLNSRETGGERIQAQA